MNVAESGSQVVVAPSRLEQRGERIEALGLSFGPRLDNPHTAGAPADERRNEVGGPVSGGAIVAQDLDLATVSLV